MTIDRPRPRLSPAFIVSVLALVLAMSGTAFAVGRGSVTSADIADNAVLSRHIKNGQVTAADLAKGAAPKPVVSWGNDNTAGALTNTDKSFVSLSEPGGGGPITVTRASRLVVNGSVSIGNDAGTGVTSRVACRAQLDGGSGFSDLGDSFESESHGNSGRNEVYNVAVVAGGKIPAGTYDVRVVCLIVAGPGNSVPIATAAALTVTAVTP